MSALQTREIPSSTPITDTFDWNFELAGNKDEVKQLTAMLEATKQFASDMVRNHNPRSLAFLGVSGTGKTHLAKALTRFFKTHCRYYVEPNTGANLSRSGGRVEWRKLVQLVREKQYGVLNDLRDDWFVCLDDTGAEHKTESNFTVSVLDDLLNARLGKWTVVTANMTLEQIANDWDARIASRLKRDNGMVVTIKGIRDWAYRKPQQEAAA